jgi:eukaryotic-like serine/threonine-protein kinase
MAVGMRIAPSLASTVQVLNLGDRRVTLDACLGKGSMAHVFRATLTSAFGVARPIACKVFNLVATEDNDAVLHTLCQIAQRAACVRHPNVAEVYELGLAGGLRQPFLVSELVEGTTLRRFVDAFAKHERRVPLDLALFIGAEMAEALAGARSARGLDGGKLGMVHLDLSARDVLLSWHGEVKVTDFELAGVRQASSSVRSLSKIARHADTMAPEIARGAMGDARSDVFSMGIVLREMLIAPRFPKGTSDADALRAARDGIVEGGPLAPQLPGDLRTVLDRALAVEPEERFPDAGAMAYELRRVALALGVGDARVFLRSALVSEVAGERGDATEPQLAPRRDENVGKRRRRRE